MEPKSAVPSSVPSSTSELGTRITAVADLYKDRKSAAIAGGISTDQLARYMRGENQPTFLVAAKMALPVRVSLDWLATGEGEMRKQPVSPVNTDLLEAAELAVHRFMEEEGVTAPPEKIARLVVVLYTYGEAKGMIKKDDLDQFLKLVA